MQQKSIAATIYMHIYKSRPTTGKRGSSNIFVLRPQPVRLRFALYIRPFRAKIAFVPTIRGSRIRESGENQTTNTSLHSGVDSPANVQSAAGLREGPVRR